jgi:hypothetical protein
VLPFLSSIFGIGHGLFARVFVTCTVSCINVLCMICVDVVYDIYVHISMYLSHGNSTRTKH